MEKWVTLKYNDLQVHYFSSKPVLIVILDAERNVLVVAVLNVSDGISFFRASVVKSRVAGCSWSM